MSDAEPRPRRRPELFLAATLFVLAAAVLLVAQAADAMAAERRRAHGPGGATIIDALTAECRDLRRALQLCQEMHAERGEQLLAARADLDDVCEGYSVALDLLAERD